MYCKLHENSSITDCTSLNIIYSVVPRKLQDGLDVTNRTPFCGITCHTSTVYCKKSLLERIPWLIPSFSFI